MRILRDESGTTAIEYGVVAFLALIFLLCGAETISNAAEDPAGTINNAMSGNLDQNGCKAVYGGKPVGCDQ